MKQIITQVIHQALSQLVESEQFSKDVLTEDIQVERTKDPKYGDFSSNIAMQLARILKANPLSIAQKIKEVLSEESFKEVSVAPPGFINFTLPNDRYAQLIQNIISEQSAYAIKPIDENSPKWLLEFVSANPTGPLHVGHGRGAAYGATLANVLKANGINAFCEYYVNDAGRQMDILAVSVYLRYLQLLDVPFSYPSNAYQATYCKEIAQVIYNEKGDAYSADEQLFKHIAITDYQAISNQQLQLQQKKAQCEQLLTDENKNQLVVIKEQLDAIKQQLELSMDSLIHNAKNHLKTNYQVFFKAALNTILDDIKNDLEGFGVHFDHWFSERSLFDEKKIQSALAVLEANDHLYKKNGATWFKTTRFGDEKDRVVQRENGLYTYFASDIAYHHDKFNRGFDYLIDLFGADHHGYMARVRAALTALGHDASKLKFELVQFAVLIQNGQTISMSTRSGKYVALRELREMIGSSAARFFYAMRKPQQHMDFDLDLAVSQSKDNPLYYIQYAHARVSSLLNKSEAEKLFDRTEITDQTIADVSQLDNSYELALFKVLDRYQDVLALSAKELAPHLLINYLKELATALHSYYDAADIKFLTVQDYQQARFSLLLATKQLLSNGLNLIGVDAPETM